MHVRSTKRAQGGAGRPTTTLYVQVGKRGTLARIMRALRLR